MRLVEAGHHEADVYGLRPLGASLDIVDIPPQSRTRSSGRGFPEGNWGGEGPQCRGNIQSAGGAGSQGSTCSTPLRARPGWRSSRWPPRRRRTTDRVWRRPGSRRGRPGPAPGCGEMLIRIVKAGSCGFSIVFGEASDVLGLLPVQLEGRAHPSPRRKGVRRAREWTGGRSLRALEALFAPWPVSGSFRITTSPPPISRRPDGRVATGSAHRRRQRPGEVAQGVGEANVVAALQSPRGRGWSGNLLSSCLGLGYAGYA